mmetsp:Transcript_22191/g.76146  ORF Transcript_22191/g.76146 Transcript_22191/m.76146 type:complete len:328 (-) Transcript_22191:14-997(-)
MCIVTLVTTGRCPRRTTRWRCTTRSRTASRTRTSSQPRPMPTSSTTRWARSCSTPSLLITPLECRLPGSACRWPSTKTCAQAAAASSCAPRGRPTGWSWPAACTCSIARLGSQSPPSSPGRLGASSSPAASSWISPATPTPASPTGSTTYRRKRAEEAEDELMGTTVQSARPDAAHGSRSTFGERVACCTSDRALRCRGLEISSKTIEGFPSAKRAGPISCLGQPAARGRRSKKKRTEKAKMETYCWAQARVIVERPPRADSMLKGARRTSERAHMCGDESAWGRAWSPKRTGRSLGELLDRPCMDKKLYWAAHLPTSILDVQSHGV